MKAFNLFITTCFVLAASLCAQTPPNIVFILCDDLGYGDVGVLYQNERQSNGLPAFDTPHLDTMAAEGAILTRHYAPAPVCAPTRASLLLGVHQGHANVRDNQFDKVLEDNHTLGSVLKSAGYATAAIGKWGLQGGPAKAGDPNSPSFPTKRGFDFFFGYLDHSAGHRHYPKEDPVDGNDPDGASTIWENNSDITSQLDLCYSTDLFTARAKKWITDQHTATPSQPFFLYLSFTAPHAALQVPTQAYPVGSGQTGGLQWTGTPGAMINTASGTRDSWIHPDYASQSGWSNANKRHATMVRRLDSAVGDLLDLLDDLGVGNDTLVVFTSDNGPHAEGSWSGVDQDPRFFRSYAGMDGIKRDTWEAGLRMPALVRWPSSITAGSTSDHPSQFHDWMPTFANAAGIPAPARSDGVSLVPSLTATGTQRDGTVYVEYSVGGSTPSYSDFEAAHRGTSWNQQQVIHLGDYKGIRHNTTSHSLDFKIYNVVTDPKETTDLAGQAGVPTQQDFRDAVLRVRRPNSSAPRAYDNEVVPSLPLVAGQQGVSWRAFESAFPWVPDFTELTPAASGNTSAPDLSVRTRDDDIGLEFTGYLDVPTTGDYTFYLSADTGAFLRLHQMQVIDADFGYTGGSELSSTVKLEAGLHPFTLGYRRGSAGTPALSLSWSGPSITKQTVPDSAFAVSTTQAGPEPSFWLLEEGSGTTTVETNSTTTTDAFDPGVSWSTDTPGPASTASLTFNGSGRFGTNLNAAATSIDGSGAKTIVGWIKTTQADKRYFWGWSPGNGQVAGGDLRLAIENGGKLRLECSSGFTRYDGLSLNDGEWHMVAAIINPGDTIADVDFYIDGDLYSPTANASTPIDTTGSGAGGEFTPDEFFFASGGNTTEQQWIGGIDDFRIYPTALTKAELDTLYEAMTAQPAPFEWPLEEGSGTSTTENRSSTVSDPLPSGVAWSTEVPGPASTASLSYNGSSGFSTNLDSSATGIDGSGAKTISAWIKTATTSEAGIFGYSPTNGGTAGADLRLLVNGAGQLRFEANVGNVALSSATVNDDDWHFVAVVIPDGATTADVLFYVDGTLASPGSAGGTAALNTATGDEIRIGSDGSVGRHFSGLIDHVRIHDRALNLAELDALRAATLTPPISAGYTSWIDGFFPGETDPVIVGLDADPDQDGVASGLEYYLGGNNDPSAAAPVPLPELELDGTNFVFSFTRSDSGETADLAAIVEVGGDLTSWPQVFNIGADTVSSTPGVTVVENGAADDLITVTIPIADAVKNFARLILTETP